MSLIARAAAAYRSWKLGRDMAAGRAPHGRVVMPELDANGCEVKVEIPMEATMSMRVIRTDGTVEDLGIVTRDEVRIPAEVLEGWPKE